MLLGKSEPSQQLMWEGRAMEALQPEGSLCGSKVTGQEQASTSSMELQKVANIEF